MHKEEKSMERITVRLRPYQMQVLRELTEALQVSYSQLVRAIILNFLTLNEDALERVVNERKELNNNKDKNDE